MSFFSFGVTSFFSTFDFFFLVVLVWGGYPLFNSVAYSQIGFFWEETM